MSKIKFASPDVGRLESKFVAKTIEGKFLTAGEDVTEFEHRVADMCHCDYAVAFDSCTGAMEMTLRMLNVGPGDEVITTPYTYSATAEVIHNVGARTVFVDLDGKSFEMDYQKVAAAITDKTKAIIPVDIGGKICNYTALMNIVDAKKDIFKPNGFIQKEIGRVAIIADAAHSFGAIRNGRMSGEWADFTCFSFHAVKSITTGGEGGMVVWKTLFREDLYCADKNKHIEKMLRLLGDHGQTSRNKDNGWEYDIALFGYNSIMTNVDAAMGLAQLERFDDIKSKRQAVTRIYDGLFEDVKTTYGVEPLIQHFGLSYMSAMHLYPIRLPGGEEERNKVYQYLLGKGILCNVHYKPLPMMTVYKTNGFDIKDYPNAYKMYASLLTIPYHNDLRVNQQEYIVDQIRKAVEQL